MPGDADLNGTVGFSDFLILSKHFGSESTFESGDFDADGKTGFSDFLILSEYFGLSLKDIAAASGGYATPTGGQGGEVVRARTGTQIHQALCRRESSDTPIVIEVEGTINHSNTSRVSGDSCDTQDDVIEIKRVSNVTLIGVGDGALFDGVGIHLRDASNIIIRNVHVRNVRKSGSPTSNGGDAIGMERNVDNVWVDHVTLEASGGEDEGFDGLLDIKADTTNVVLSYSVLLNSGRGGLVGSNEDDTSNGPITWHHNVFENLDSRVPLVRGADAHIYNNWYKSISKSGINSRAGARVKVEHNYFEDSKDILGTFYTDTTGTWEVSHNIDENVTWSKLGPENKPAGPNPTSTTAFDVPYYYLLDPADCLRELLSEIAGANKGVKDSDGSCNIASSRE